MSDYKSIRVNPVAKEKLQSLAKRRGKSETDFANNMINFVYQTGLDIYDVSAPPITELIKGLDNRMVSFLKKREQDFFVPMFSSFREMIKLHNQTLETLDILHPGEIGFVPKDKKEEKTIKKPTLILPEKKALEVPETDLQKEARESQKQTGENTEKQAQILSEKEDEYLRQIERAEKEKNTFEKELKFLIENIVPNRSISGPRFTCNLPQKEIDRIKNLVDGD